MGTQMKVVLEQIRGKGEFTFQLIRVTLQGITYSHYFNFIYAYILSILSTLGDYRDRCARSPAGITHGFRS
jgi:hypothetical protein